MNRRIDVWNVVFVFLLIAFTIWLLYKIYQELTQNAEQLKERIVNDTIHFKLDNDTHLRLVRTASRYYHIALSGIYLIICSIVCTMIYFGIPILESIGITTAIVCFLTTSITLMFCYRLNPEILLERFKSMLLRRVYRKNGLEFLLVQDENLKGNSFMSVTK